MGLKTVTIVKDGKEAEVAPSSVKAYERHGWSLKEDDAQELVDNPGYQLADQGESDDDQSESDDAESESYDYYSDLTLTETGDSNEDPREATEE